MKEIEIMTLVRYFVEIISASFFSSETNLVVVAKKLKKYIRQASRHNTLYQCWIIAGQASETLA